MAPKVLKKIKGREKITGINQNWAWLNEKWHVNWQNKNERAKMNGFNEKEPQTLPGYNETWCEKMNGFNEKWLEKLIFNTIQQKMGQNFDSLPLNIDDIV